MPSDSMMQQAMQLGIPMFSIIEDPIQGKKKTAANSGAATIQTRVKNNLGGGSIELFCLMNKEAIQILRKNEKLEKSSSTEVKHFKLAGAQVDLDTQLQLAAKAHKGKDFRKRKLIQLFG